MLAVAVSSLFGLAAFAALAQIHRSLSRGIRSHRAILGELSLYAPARHPVRSTGPQSARLAAV